MGNEIMMQAFERYLPDDGNYYKNLAKEAKTYALPIEDF